MSKPVLLLLLVLIFGLSSCLSTRVTSIVDLNYRDSSFSRILVVGNFEQLEQTQLFENEMVMHLRDSGIFAVANSRLLPPLRKYSDSEISAVYAKYSLDACLILSSMGEKTTMFQYPGWTSIDQKINAGHRIGSFEKTTVTTSVSQHGGSTKTTFTVGTKAELRDVKNGAVVSRCEANSEQISYGSTSSPTIDNAIVGSVCQEMIGEFNRNKLLRKMR